MEFDMKPEEFIQYVARTLRSEYPCRAVEIHTNGTLSIDGNNFNPRDLYKLYQHRKIDSIEAVKNSLANIFGNKETNIEELPLPSVQYRIMPKMESGNIFERLDRKLTVHRQFVNNTYIFFVGDYPNSTISLVNKGISRWGICLEDIEHIARRNLETRTSNVEWENTEDEITVAKFQQHDGYDAARLLLPDLHERLSPKLGREFYVAIPNRDTFLAIPIQPISFIEKVLAEAKKDYEKKPYPVSPNLFYVTQDGIAGTVHDPIEE